MKNIIPSLILCCGLLVLAGCEDDASTAERYYQSGLALIEEGDNERAIIELRNVFQHDGFHKEARETYAALLIEMGRKTEAYSQYLRLVEQYPDTLQARVTLAELAIETGNWDEAERHGAAAIALDSEALDVQAIDLVLKYRTASLEQDTDTRAAIAVQATALLAQIRSTEGEDNRGLVQITVDQLIQTEQLQEALETVNAALEQTPENYDLNRVKAQLLARLENTDALGAQLKRMVEITPDDDAVKQALINWFMSQEDTDGAEAFLREQAGDDTGPTEGHVTVIQLLGSTKGPEVAKAEITRLKAANEGTANGRFYATMLITIEYGEGQQEQAIADLRDVIAQEDEGDAKNTMRIALIRMLTETGGQGEADGLVEEILADDSSNVSALQLQASRLIREDKSGEAIVALRRALDQNPRNSATLTLMAQAHQRDGDINLAGERLSLAMEVSGNAPAETIRYARFLASQGRPQVAITALEEARRNAPGNALLLQTLTNLYISTSNWSQAESIVAELRAFDTPVARQAATELQAQILRAQDRTRDSIQALQAQLTDPNGSDAPQNLRTTLLITQAQIQSGDFVAARATVDEARTNFPDNPDLQLLDASLRAGEDDVEGAEAGYRDLIARFPENAILARLLFNLLTTTGQPDAAMLALDDALERMPQEPTLQGMKASLLEQGGDFDGAIAVYEDMYSRDSFNPVVANNLASLITSHRDDADSLSRAAIISRRLRGTQVPAFQDTYGWIAYRRGDFEEAVAYLEPAATVLSQDALVQYHLGMTYVALSRRDDAIEALKRALEMAGDSTLPQFDAARTALKDLEQTP